MSQQYKAIADFKGEEAGDLSFHTGEILTILSERADGWLNAENSEGRRGFVPSTFLEGYKKRTTMENSVVEKDDAGSDKEVESEVEDEEELESEEDEDEEDLDSEEEDEEGEVSNDLRQKKSVNQQYKAIVDFKGEEAGDLSFHEGEILTIWSERSDGWLDAENSEGKRGFVPSTFLQVYNNHNSLENSEVGKNGAESDEEVKSEVEDEEDLESEEDEDEEDLDSEEEDEEGENDKDLRQKKSVNQQYKAIVDFEGEEAGDLSFQTGEILTIVSERADGWLDAVNSEGKRGFVPSTFLQKCKKLNSVENFAVGIDDAQSEKEVESEVEDEEELESEEDEDEEDLDSEEEDEEGEDNKDFRQKKSVNKQYKALTDFKGEEPGDLSFNTGEILTVLSERSDGWLDAENSEGKRGFVPSTFLQVYNKHNSVENAEESYEKQRGDQKETIKGKKAPETRQYEDKTGAVGKNDAESDEGVSQKGTCICSLQ